MRPSSPPIRISRNPSVFFERFNGVNLVHFLGIPPPRKRKLVETTQQIREKLPLIMPKKYPKNFPLWGTC